MAIRKHSRFAVTRPVSFFGKNISGKGTLVSLSRQGCEVSTTTSPAYASLLTMNIDLYGGASPVVIHKAAVRWSAAQKFGTEFLQIEKTELKRLQAFLNTLQKNPGP